MPGGVIEAPNENIDVILMHDSAHHNDMRSPDPADPPDVVKGRDLWKTCINKWIGTKAV
jgi:lysosomal Pro-X carboxypeptidase